MLQNENNDDKIYWENYYKKKTKLQEASLFAKWIKKQSYLDIKSIIDVGCGSGRDTYYLSNPEPGWSIERVVGLDCAVKPKDKDNATFIKDDVKNISGKYDLLYSRFSLHSIRVEEEDRLLEYARTNCKFIAIECRTNNDKLNNGKERIETSYAKAHYRRFVNLDELSAKLDKLGFKILYKKESINFAPYKDQRPSCLRIVASI